MRIQVIRPDNLVIVDGVEKPIDCSSLPKSIKIIRLDTSVAEGEIEAMDYDEATGRPLKTPKIRETTITKVGDVQGLSALISAWNAYVEPPIPPEPTTPQDNVTQFLDRLRRDPAKLQKLSDFIDTL